MRLPKLKPCPFCGARPKLWIGLSEFTDGEIHCPCGCTSGNHPNADAAIEAWNTRPETDHLIAEAVAAERDRCMMVAIDYPVPIGCTKAAAEIAAAIRTTS